VSEQLLNIPLHLPICLQPEDPHGTTIVMLVTAPNAGELSKFFHTDTQRSICNKFIITYPTIH